MKTLLACLLALACLCAKAADVMLEFWADDGARVFIDDNSVIDDWRPTPETEPRSHRTANVSLTPGLHRIVVEYFQGESLPKNDADPAKLYWTVPSLNVPRQVIPAAHFFHSAADEQDVTPSTKKSKGGKTVSVQNNDGDTVNGMKAGLVAHYYKDPTEWGGNWKPNTEPTVSAKDWTFRQYAYSRVEPLINHLFVKRGWFSIRWVGYLQLVPGGSPDGSASDGTTANNGNGQGQGSKGNNGVGNGVDPAPPGNPPVNDGAGTGPGNPGNQGGTPSNSGGNGNSQGQGSKGNNGVGNGVDPAPPGNPPVNDGAGTGPGNPGNQGGTPSNSGGASNGQGQGSKGNNGVGNGVDPAPPGNPPVNDGAGTGPGNPGNKGGAKKQPAY
ncbi:MAG TPA: PA14 domain-containing protein [Planctomycetota bacterium]|jgi:hypothetical protein